MKTLDQIFNREDIAQMIEWACGKKHDKFDVEIHTFDLEELEGLSDREKAIFAIDHGAESKLVARFNACVGGDKPLDDEHYDFMLVIKSDGDVSYQNFGGCRFGFAEPLKIYQMVFDRFREAEEENGDQEDEYSRGYFDGEQGTWHPDPEAPILSQIKGRCKHARR